MGEANLPTQEAKADANPRVPGPYVDASGPGRDQEPSPPGPPPTGRLIWRVRDRSTLRALSTTRRRRRGPLSLAVVDHGATTPPRVAYAVSKKVGGAVVRNRVRRRLRAAVRNHVSDLRRGAAYLIGASSGAGSLDFAELDAAVHALVTETHRPMSSGASR